MKMFHMKHFHFFIPTCSRQTGKHQGEDLNPPLDVLIIQGKELPKFSPPLVPSTNNTIYTGKILHK